MAILTYEIKKKNGEVITVDADKFRIIGESYVFTASEEMVCAVLGSEVSSVEGKPKNKINESSEMLYS